MKTGFCFILILPLLWLTEAMAGSDLKVVVSIKPFHSLVSAVMQGVSEPILLLNGNSSPHSFSLRPSDADSLQNATLVFWGGERLEQFLAKPIHSLAASAKLVSLQETPGLRFWPLRSGKNRQKIENEASLDRQRSNENENGWPLGVDPHIWLDPLNAKMITQNIVQILSDLDPENAKIIRSNGEKAVIRLNELDQQLRTEMSDVSARVYMVFHDAFQYFEKRYQLNYIGSVTHRVGHASSVRRLREVRKTIKKNKVRCIFYEPQFSPKLVQTVIAGSSVKKGELDPLGAGLVPGVELYFTLLNNLSRSLRTCLS